MNNKRKAQILERALLAMLLTALGAAGFCYQRFRGEVPDWQLIGLVIAGMCIAYGFYRFALNLGLRKLGY